MRRKLLLLNGKAIAQGFMAEVFAEPMDPYIRKLLMSVPELRKGWLEEITA